MARSTQKEKKRDRRTPNSHLISTSKNVIPTFLMTNTVKVNSVRLRIRGVFFGDFFMMFRMQLRADARIMKKKKSGLRRKKFVRLGSIVPSPHTV